ncbi:MAG TPA: hypothetical protein PK957_04180 [Candidatus Dojkabacteria bacterium]|nr:hypothetical protein [Candidatus Dojkabacteria bacterium]
MKNDDRKILIIVIIIFILVLTGVFVLSIMYFSKQKSIISQENKTKHTYNKPIVIDSLAQLLQTFNNEKGFITLKIEAQDEVIKCYFEKGFISGFETNNILFIKDDAKYIIIDHTSQTIVEIDSNDIKNYEIFKQRFTQIEELSLLSELSAQYQTKPYLFMYFGAGIYDYTSQENDKYIQILINQNSTTNSLSVRFTTENTIKQSKAIGELSIESYNWDIDWEKITREYTITNSDSIIKNYIE